MTDRSGEIVKPSRKYMTWVLIVGTLVLYSVLSYSCLGVIAQFAGEISVTLHMAGEFTFPEVTYLPFLLLGVILVASIAVILLVATGQLHYRAGCVCLALIATVGILCFALLGLWADRIIHRFQRYDIVINDSQTTASQVFSAIGDNHHGCSLIGGTDSLILRVVPERPNRVAEITRALADAGISATSCWEDNADDAN